MNALSHDDCMELFYRAWLFRDTEGMQEARDMLGSEAPESAGHPDVLVNRRAGVVVAFRLGGHVLQASYIPGEFDMLEHLAGEAKIPMHRLWLWLSITAVSDVLRLIAEPTVENILPLMLYYHNLYPSAHADYCKLCDAIGVPEDRRRTLQELEAWASAAHKLKGDGPLYYVNP